MAVVRAFRAVRPVPEKASEVAALPYDVYSREEAKQEVQGKPLSFLNIDRPETQYGPEFDMYSEEAYKTAARLLSERIQDGTFLREEKPAFYLYELTVEGGALAGLMKGHVQTGIVACSSVDDYLNDVIRKHENTREEKEQDRIRHVDVCGAQTGPIFLAYRKHAALKDMIAAEKEGQPAYDFRSDDGIRHRVWVIDDQTKVERITEFFREVPATYIADGHHRAASAVKVALKRRKENPGYTGEEEFNYFLSVLFQEDELKILPYYRVVKDLAGLSFEDLLMEADAPFSLWDMENEAVQPEAKGVFGMYLMGRWFRMEFREELREDDPVDRLDVSVLQDHLLGRVLEIDDPRTSDRIVFVGGIRGTGELERLVDEVYNGEGAAFSLFPTTMLDLLSVADAGRLMPPKSTWFEPKLRSGLFIHMIDE